MAETFLTAWRRLSDVPDEPLPWLLVVAKNVLLNMWRGNRRRQALAVKLEAAPSGPAGTVEADPADQIAAIEAVRAALDRLPDHEREALMLSFWDNLDRPTAVMVAGCTPGTFAVRLHRARKRLMKEMESSGHLPGDGRLGEVGTLRRPGNDEGGGAG